MKSQIELENLIRTARAGDERAKAEIYTKLFERFSPIVTQQLLKYPILANRMNIEEKTYELCQKAIDEIKKLYPIMNSTWKLTRAMKLLRCILDSIIIDLLADFAKNGDSEAENLLFFILEQKLKERIIRKR